MNEDIIIEHVKDLSQIIHKTIFDYLIQNFSNNDIYYDLFQIVISSGISGTVAALNNIKSNTKDDEVKKIIDSLIENFIVSLKFDWSVIDKSLEKKQQN